jgi:hypothetical protein
VVDVCVRENNRIELFYRKRKPAILLGCFLSLALKHSAVQGDGASIYVKQVARARDLSCRTDECNFQMSAFCYCVALKQNYQSLAIL